MFPLSTHIISEGMLEVFTRQCCSFKLEFQTSMFETTTQVHKARDWLFEVLNDKPGTQSWLQGGETSKCIVSTLQLTSREDPTSPLLMLVVALSIITTCEV